MSAMVLVSTKPSEMEQASHRVSVLPMSCFSASFGSLLRRFALEIYPGVASSQALSGVSLA